MTRSPEVSPLDALRAKLADLETSRARELRALDALRGALYAPGLSFFDCVTMELAQGIGADHVFIGVLQPGQRSVRTVSLCVDGKIEPAVEYELADTPCADVVGKDLCAYPRGVQALFPRDQMLGDMRIEGYCGVPLFDSRKRPVGLIVVMARHPLEDVQRMDALLRVAAVRASAELERTRAQAQMRSLFEANMMGIFFWDAAGVVTQANDTFLAMIGYGRDDVDAGRVLMTDLTSPEHLVIRERAVKELAAKGSWTPFERDFIRKDGTRVPAMVGASRLTETPLTGVSYVLDLSALKGAERSAKEISDLNCHIIGSIEEGLIVHDRELRYVHFNHVMEGITGVKAKDVIGRLPQEVFPALEKMGIYATLQRALKGETLVSPVLPYHHHGTGESRWTSTQVSPLRGHGGAIDGVIAVIRDVTELKLAEQALVDSEKKLTEALRASEDRVVQLEEQVQARSSFEGMIGKSPAMQDVYRRLRLAAQSDVTVLITGESGTGKELAAASVHALSHRAKQPFITVNCAAIPESLLESELFGHVKGAFTGATRDKVGLFQAADGGTLFLDEVGDMSPVLQVKILRALQEREIRRVGDERQIKVNVRLVTATNKDLADLIAKGTLREDFYYRIRVFEIRLPSLRERREDVALLLQHYVRVVSEAHGKPAKGVEQGAMRRLMDYDWPGNVRELRNAVEHAFVTMQGDALSLQDFPPEIRGVARGRGDAAESDDEGARILAELRKTGGNQTRAAKNLGISRVTLWSRMKQLGIKAGKAQK